MDWARQNNVFDVSGFSQTVSFQTLCASNAELKKVVHEEMVRLGNEKKLTGLEKPREFVLWHELCTVENNLITPTFKMKRNIAAQVFEP